MNTPPEIVFVIPEVPQINFLIDLQGQSLYSKWLELELGTGDYTAFLNWLRIKGDNGATPTIGENGNWFIAGIDSGLTSRGLQGEPLRYSDLTPEQIAELQAPALEAAQTANEAAAIALQAAADAQIGVTIERTSGNGAAGTDDTYTITLSNGASTTFTIHNGSNGSNGRGITSVVRTSGTGAAGTTDIYTITFTDNTTTTFNVVNGANGTGATLEQVRSQSTGNVPSSKLLDDELNKKIDTATATIELSKKVNKVESTKETKIKDLSDGLYITDLQGNVMFKVLVDGAQALSYKIIDNATKEVVATMDKSWLDYLYSGSFLTNIRMYYKNDTFYFTDPAGYVMAKLNANGFQAIKFLDKNGDTVGTPPKKLQDKKVVSLGDSHRTANWLSKFCELTGAINSSVIDAYIQANEYSFNDTGLMIGQARALNQYSLANAFTPDIILIENCHYQKAGVITDYVPQIYDVFQTYGTIYSSYNTFLANINTDKAAFVASLTPKVKTALRFRFNTYKETLTFASSGSLSAGTITLTIDGNNFAINITAGMTLSQAVTALNDWAFNEYLTYWTNASTKGATRVNTIELIYTGSSNPPAEPTVSFNGGTTGMTYSGKAQTTTVGSQDYYFNSLSLADWNNSAKWIGQNGTGVYPNMKGLIEYLKVKFPLAEIVVWGVQWLNVSQTPSAATSFMVETYAGSGQYVLDISKYYLDSGVSTYYASKLAMQEVSNYYNIRFLDVDKECGINIFNMFTGGYFAANNLHPLAAGYDKWGETLAKLY